MAIRTPDTAKQVEDRIKIDVQRELPESNPYLLVHWLRSFIAGVGRRIFDFYLDLTRTESRLMPDTADQEKADQWGVIYVGPRNVATPSSGNVVAQGTAGSSISIGKILTAGDIELTVTAGGTISDQVINVSSITRSGTTATVTTDSAHNLASTVPVTIDGADQSEYNLADAAITVTGLDTFTYQVSGSPVDATGTLTAAFTSASIGIESTTFGDDTNLDLDTPVTLQSPIVGVNDTLNVDFGTVGGGTDEESTPDYKVRYLEKIRNPVAHFNTSDIIAEAKKVAGVTRVFVSEAGTEIGSFALTGITRTGNVANATAAALHGLVSGQTVTVFGADQVDYNVVDAVIIVASGGVFHYIVENTPVSPATGTLTATGTIPMGQVQTHFMRDNDENPIPSASEVQTVKAQIDTIRPANTASVDNIVSAPVAVPTDYTFTELTPDTATMRAAVEANLDQFYAEQTTVSVDVDEDAYRSAIKNTVDPDTGDTVQTFTLSAPSGDIPIDFGEIATKGNVSF